MQLFLGLPIDLWTLFLTAFNTLIVIVGVFFAIDQLRKSTRQRMNDSYERMLEEFREKSFGDARAEVIEHFPVFKGTTEERIEAFLEHGRRLSSQSLHDARTVVNKLNDVGALVDRKAIREDHFFVHAHPKIIELAARLDPLILTSSVKRKSRWGMRVRRMRDGAARYYRTTKLYYRGAFEVNGVELVPAGRAPFLERVGMRFRRIFGRPVYQRTAKSWLDRDDTLLASVGAVMAKHTEQELRFLDELLT